jgi:uncharacterized membrane protein
MKNIIKCFKSTTTSKKLTALIVAFWFIVIIADIVIYLITGSTINEIVNYVHASFLVVIAAYFGKSALENTTAIKTTNSTSAIDNTDTTDHT